ncbi:MAG: hypothetical protein DRP93_08170, partial [Candidatus Neomarinimicrobiota bacterium]
MKLEHKDYFVTLMISFIFFLLLLFMYLFKISSDVKNYDKYHDWIVQLKIIDKEFDNFLLQKHSFTNYDNITQLTSEFENALQRIEQSHFESEFGREFNESFRTISAIFKEKKELIEYFKSNNAIVLNSMHYLFDLNKMIDNDSNISIPIKKLSREILFNLLQILIKTNTIPNASIQKLNQLNLYLESKERDSVEELTYFVKHASITLKNIEKFHYVEKERKNLPLYNTLENIHERLDSIYHQNLFFQRLIALFAFISAFIIVFALIIVYRRSLLVKRELMAFRFAVEHSDNSVVMTDASRNIVYVNDVFERDSGYSAAEAIGQNPRILKSNMIDQSYYDDLNATLNRGEKWEGEFTNKRKDGSIFHEKASIVPVFINNKLVNYLAIKLDISKYIEQQKQMDHMAYYDTLTNLPNRAYFEDKFQHVLEISHRNQLLAGILFIDLDRFKIINDTLGHPIGDKMLKTVSKRISSVL